jgi:hypothetical protein
MTRRASLTGISTDAPGGDAGTKYYPRTEIIRMPAGSIVSIPRYESPLEPIDLAEARLKKALLFAIPLSLFLWILIGLAAWGLVSVFR